MRGVVPSLVASDLDGTLLRSDGTVSDFTADVIGRLDHAGVPFVMVTARPLRWMEDLMPLVGEHGIVVCSNGARVHDVASGEALELHGIEPGEGIALAEAIRKAVPGVGFALELASGFAREPAYTEMHDPPPGHPVGTLVDIWTSPALKMLVQHDTLDPAVFRSRVFDVTGDQATWTIDRLMEIGPVGVSKGAALAGVVRRLGVDPAGVIAFGDMPNDLPMLAAAGTSYAVANAHPDVRAAADHVVPSNDEDGVARTIADLLVR